MSSYPITDINGIEPEEVAALKAAGIRTTEKLLDAAKDAKGRKRLGAKTSIGAKRLLDLANVADYMRIKGMGGAYAELVRAVGVDTVREFKYRNPRKLAQAMRAANDKRKLVRLLPSERTIGRWIEIARRLSQKITY
jgi:predicted RecB family nuclease